MNQIFHPEEFPMEITASMTNHAMNDAVPLRFGIIPPRYVVLKEIQVDEFSTSNQKPKEIKSGNQHLVARCYSQGSGEFLFRGRFVVGEPRNYEAHKTIITVLSVNPDKSERAVSDLIKHLRETNKIDAMFIKDKLHPKYVAGEISGNEDFYEYLVELGVQDRVQDLQTYIQQLESASEEKQIQLATSEKEKEEFRRRIIELEKQKTDYKGEEVSVSPICTLVSVEEGQRTNRRGETIRCTYLKFEEPVPDRKMDEIFDRNGTITAKARNLIGQKVQTSTWKPEIFKPLEWFRDIYTVD
jgi:hypothetical protein